MRDHRLRKRRGALGLTQSQIGRSVGLHQTSVSVVERGGGDASLVRKVRRAIVLAERAAGLAGRRPRLDPPPNDPTKVTRALAGKIPASKEADALFDAMANRIWALWDGGKFEEGDFILEFLPEPMVDQLLEEFFGWEAGEATG